jgi:hypothetical protein
VLVQLGLGHGPESIEVHGVIIRSARLRGAVALASVLVVAGVGLGMRPAGPAEADPALAVERAERLTAAATAADDALAGLDGILTSALDQARRGAARTAAGDRDPAVELVAAADRLDTDAVAADAARRGLVALAGTAASLDPGARVPELSFSGPELLEIAAQLRAAAEAATLFVERRNATTAVVEALGAGVAALDADDPALALEHFEAATAPLLSLEEWDARPPLLRHWEMVIGRLLEAATAIAQASIDGDPAAVDAAAAAYREAGELARGADNALAVALAEEASAVSATPLRRLAARLGEVADVRAAVRRWLPPSPG